MKIGASLCILALYGCASTGWRAEKLTNIEGTAGIYKIDEHRVNADMLIQKFRLDNGLKVIILEDHSAPVFAYHTWFNVGSRNEREGITGIAHLFEHLMFKETKNTKEGEFDRILEEQGGNINAATYVDWTFYRESMPKEAFHLIPKLEADRMQWMILSDKQVNAEREVVANERRMRVDNSPDGQMSEALYKSAFQRHPYHWPVIGWMKDIEAITLKDCVQFYQTYYSPNNATIVLVGDVDTGDALRRIAEHYGKIPAATIPAETFVAEPEQTEERRVAMQLTIPQEKLLLGYKAPPFLHKDFNVLSVINGLLFEGHSSRLYRKLVSDTNIASEASGSLDQTKDGGLYTVSLTMSEGRKVEEAQKIVEAELEDLKRNLVTEEELARTKNRVETSFWSAFATADDKAQNLGFYELTARDYRTVFSEIQELQSVSREQIQAAAKAYFQNQRRTVVVAKPKKA